MGKFFNRNKNNDNEFAKPSPLSGGNQWELYNKLITQKDIDINSLNNSLKNSIRKTLSNINKNKIAQFKMDNWYLLLLHSNYFTSTIVFECNNFNFKAIMFDVIKHSWLNGIAGIYFDKKVNKAYGILISNIKYNTYGEIEEIDYYISALVGNINYDKLKDNKDIVVKKIKGVEECKNVAIFKWGTLAIGAYILYYPFVKFQNKLLTMMIAQAYTFNKKFVMEIANEEEAISELDEWFNEENTFITLIEGGSLNIKSVDNAAHKTLPEDFMTFYKEYIGCMYAMYGRRMNLDFKRERNTVEEVSLTSGAIENIERDWINQFKIFVEQIEDINKRLKIIPKLKITNIALNNWLKEARDEGIFEDDTINENDIIKEK